MKLDIDLEIDASGLSCPLPLLKAKQGLNQLNNGQTVRVLATDPGSVRDFHAFIDLSTHKMLRFEESETEFVYILQKGGLEKGE